MKFTFWQLERVYFHNSGHLNEGDESEPVLKYSHNCGESVNSVEGGVVGSAGFDEIVASTYTGWVFGLTTENVESRSRMQRDSIGKPNF